MKTFHVQTLGCKVNHYESDQIAAHLVARGLTPADATSADLRVINTCSVTTQAASQSRQSVRRMVRLPVLASEDSHRVRTADQIVATVRSADPTNAAPEHRTRVIVTGCWATSNTSEAAGMPGVDAVLGHHHDVALELDRLLTLWQSEEAYGPPRAIADHPPDVSEPPNSLGKNNGWQVESKIPVGQLTPVIGTKSTDAVNGKLRSIGTTSLPLLGRRQANRQRAFLKIQDGCDAHCTYCIIPALRPSLWSKPVDAVVEEARALVDAGHAEIILTGIFLGAYGQPTALRRRQPRPTAEPLGELIDALCTRVPGLRRLRLSSLEPGDLNAGLLKILRSHEQVVPHFHLPLQSGTDHLLRRMNRQYTRDDFLKMVDQVNEAFDRPALTTDIVAGFPGETDEEFERTVEVARAAGFIHIHAFPYSPRPGTAAARWTNQFIRGPVVNERIEILRELAADQSFAFRSTFIGETVEVIVERDAEMTTSTRHGRCERYFDVEIDDANLQPGESARALITDVSRDRTIGILLVGPASRAGLFAARVALTESQVRLGSPDLLKP